MPLDKEQVKALLAVKPKRASKGKKTPDSSVRDLQTWFALAPQTRDQLGTIDLRCDNPNCIDPRPARISALDGSEIKHQFVVLINDVKVCRYCFLDGYLLSDPSQGQLAV